MADKKTKLTQDLLKKMKKEGATPIPQESTYVQTAHEQAMAGEMKEAYDTMQYSAKEPAVSQIAKQDAERGKAVGDQIVKNVLERMRKRKGK